MALRRTYYKLTLREDKIGSMTTSLEDVLDIFGVVDHPMSGIYEIANFLKDNYRHNSPIESRRCKRNYLDENVALGFAISLQPLFKKVDESKILIELCPRLISTGNHTGLARMDYQLNLMIRYYKSSDLVKFTEMLDELYTYIHVENDG